MSDKRRPAAARATSARRRDDGLTHEGGNAAVGIGEQTGRQDREARLANGAKPTLLEPAPDQAVVRAQTPVLVDHQTDRSGGSDEVSGLLERRRQRLLAQNRDAAGDRVPRDRNVSLSGRRNVDRRERLTLEHFGGIVVDSGDAERLRPLRGPFSDRVRDRDHARPCRPRPCDQMVAADHAAARDADLQGFSHDRR